MNNTTTHAEPRRQCRGLAKHCFSKRLMTHSTKQKLSLCLCPFRLLHVHEVITVSSFAKAAYVFKQRTLSYPICAQTHDAMNYGSHGLVSMGIVILPVPSSMPERTHVKVEQEPGCLPRSTGCISSNANTHTKRTLQPQPHAEKNTNHIDAYCRVFFAGK